VEERIKGGSIDRITDSAHVTIIPWAKTCGAKVELRVEAVIMEWVGWGASLHRLIDSLRSAVGQTHHARGHSRGTRQQPQICNITERDEVV